MDWRKSIPVRHLRTGRYMATVWISIPLKRTHTQTYIEVNDNVFVTSRRSI
jgi:hypothetical protein